MKIITEWNSKSLIRVYTIIKILKYKIYLFNAYDYTLSPIDTI